MTTLNLSVPESMKAFLETQAGRLGFSSVDDYLHSIIVELQRRETKRELDQQLLEGLRSPVTRMTDKDWEDLEKQVRERSPELNRS